MQVTPLLLDPEAAAAAAAAAMETAVPEAKRMRTEAAPALPPALAPALAAAEAHAGAHAGEGTMRSRYAVDKRAASPPPAAMAAAAQAAAQAAAAEAALFGGSALGSARRATGVAAVCWLLQMPPEPSKFDVSAVPPHGGSVLLAAVAPACLPRHTCLPRVAREGSGRAQGWLREG